MAMVSSEGTRLGTHQLTGLLGAGGMKRTRKISITEKIFTAEDVRRLALILDEQKEIALDEGRHISAEFEVRFDDGTSIEGESPAVYSDETLTAASRPVAIRMSFRDYHLARSASLAFEYGDNPYGNRALMTGDEDWSGRLFAAIKDVLDHVRPQRIWLRSHRTLLLNLIAFGIGSLVLLGVEILLSLILPTTPLGGTIKPLAADSPWRSVIRTALPYVYVGGWAVRWFGGLLWGAFAVRDWLLKAWPGIELDFGREHVRAERDRRQRLKVLVLLVVFPILTTLGYDCLKLLLIARGGY